MPVNIAIDGPSGAGKSTLARRLAGKLGYIYVDTGALYRAIALSMLRRNAETEEQIIQCLPELDIRLSYVNGEQHVFANNEDVSGLIRTPEVTMAASRVSAVPQVRKFLFDLQQDLARENSVVMDGRDIGTAVLPNADIKIFLTASPEKRAMRRWLEMQEKHIDGQTFEEVLADVIQRDQQDMNREIAPLKQADDAVLVDTSDLDLEESEELLLKVCKENLQG